MSTIILEAKPQHWVCPNCAVTAVTRDQANRYHACRGLAGLTAPLVPADSQRAQVVTQVREDYVGKEIVQYDGEGRPITAIITDRWDGSNDTDVLAPTARGGSD